MATSETGNWLNQYVAPQLLVEFKNFKDDFIGVLPGANPAAITADGIRFNKLINNVGFYVDNTQDFSAKKMTGQKVFVPWEKYDTDPTEVDDAEIRGLNYDKRSMVRVKHTEAFKMGIRDHVMWKLAPATSASADMPVMRTTGVNDGTGRLRLLFADLIKYLEKIKGLNLPDESQFFIVLCPEHETDLMLDRDSAQYFADKNIFFDVTTGKVKSVMGFKFFSNNAVLAYDNTGAKKAKGAALASTDRRASLFFYAPNAVYHIESVKILYAPETQDTKSADPKSTFRLQTYGLIDRVVDYGFGAIVSGIASASSPTVYADVAALSFEAVGEAKVVETSCVNNTTVSITGTGFTKVKSGQTITVTAAANVGAARTGTLRVTDVVTGGYIEIALSQLAGA